MVARNLNNYLRKVLQNIVADIFLKYIVFLLTIGCCSTVHIKLLANFSAL